MIAFQTVHTTGIDVQSLIALLSGIAVIVGVFVTFLTWRINRKDASHEAEIASLRGEITSSINNLSEVLMAKLETKEAVRLLGEKIARIEGRIDGRQ